MSISLTQAGLIGIGGAVGAIARAVVREVTSSIAGEAFPWGTFVVNVSGSFAAGLISGILTRFVAPALWRDLLITGFLGGYTTFSAFELDALGLWRGGARLSTVGYLAGSVLGGLIAVIAGYALAEKWPLRPLDGAR